MPPIDKLLSQYSAPVRSWPGEEDLDAEARANYAAANPRPPQQLRPDERYRGAFLPFRETTDGRHEWAVPGLLQDVFDSARAVRDTSGLGLGPALPPSQMRQEEFDQVLGHGMAGAMTGVTGGLARAAVSPRLTSGEMELGIFGGRQAKTADMAALARAEEMTAAGAPREQIWKDTGWFRGPDGKWKFEIDDSGSQYVEAGMKPKEYKIFGDTVMGREGVVGEVLPHDLLSAAYPDIPGMKVTRTNYQDGRLGHYDKGGGFANMDEHIALNMGSPMFQGRSTMLHELQHAVQNREGFHRGATPSQFSKDGTPNPAHKHYLEALATDPELMELAKLRESGAYDRALAAINENYEKNFKHRYDELEDLPVTRETYRTEIKPKFDALFAESEASNRLLSPDYARHDDLYKSLRQRGIPPTEPAKLLMPEDAYRAAAGEAEARAVQTRMDMTPEQRASRPPWLDYDVPEGSQILDLVEGLAGPASWRRTSVP